MMRKTLSLNPLVCITSTVQILKRTYFIGFVFWNRLVEKLRNKNPFILPYVIFILYAIKLTKLLFQCSTGSKKKGLFKRIGSFMLPAAALTPASPNAQEGYIT